MRTEPQAADTAVVNVGGAGSRHKVQDILIWVSLSGAPAQMLFLPNRLKAPTVKRCVIRGRWPRAPRTPGTGIAPNPHRTPDKQVWFAPTRRTERGARRNKERERERHRKKEEEEEAEREEEEKGESEEKDQEKGKQEKGEGEEGKGK